MKVKFPFTEEFLWNLYNMIEGADKAYDIFAPKSFREVLCPELFRLRKYYARQAQRRSFSQFIYYLKRKGYLRQKKLGNRKALFLTAKGFERVLRRQNSTNQLLKRKDGKLQMIMYDIPEERRKDRGYLRRALLALGYSKLQKSIWISHYDVFNRTERLINDHNLRGYVHLFLIEEKF